MIRIIFERNYFALNFIDNSPVKTHISCLGQKNYKSNSRFHFNSILKYRSPLQFPLFH